MLKISKSPESENVRECMIWHYGNSAKGARRQPTPQSRPDSQTYQPVDTEYDFMGLSATSPQKAEIGGSKSYAYEVPQSMMAHPKKDEGTVIEALRGWPGYRNTEEVNQGSAHCYDNQPAPSGPVSDPKKDPYMVDLIAHSYMRGDGTSGQGQQDADGTAQKSRVPLSGGKATRTSQLRHLVNNEKAHPVEQELWKMPKFTKGAKPAISTFRTSSGKKGKGGDGDTCRGYCASPSNYGAGAVCTCGTEQPSYGNYHFESAAPEPMATIEPKLEPCADIPPPAPNDSQPEKKGHAYFEVGL